MEDTKARELLTLYRDRLTDLTGRNKSLKLMKLYNKNHFDLFTLNHWQTGQAASVLEEVASRKELVPFLPTGDLSENGMSLAHRLTQLKREIDLIEQETGMNTFYVAYGFLEGYFHEDLFIRSPLLFYPAKIKRVKIRGILQWVIESDLENDPFLNRTFLLAAQKFANIQIGDELERQMENLPKDLSQVLPFVTDLLAGYNIPVSLDLHPQTPATEQMDLFANLPVLSENGSSYANLIPFKNMTSKDAPDYKKGFTIRPCAVIGKYQQSTSTLLHDYQYLLQHFPTEGLLHDLFRSSDEHVESNDHDKIDNEILNHVHETDNYFVTETDASQEAVVAASRDSRGLIVHGPPGTGKSQVIVNLVADRMARGERVLVVCQKPTALNVVYNRLGSIHLQKHVAQVHDYAKSKGYVYSKLANVLERTAQHQDNQLDHLSEEMQTLSERLNRIARSLHIKRPFGKTLYWLYNHARWDSSLRIDVSKLMENMTYEELRKQSQTLREIVLLMSKYDQPNHPWSNRKNFASYTIEDHRELEEMLTDIMNLMKQGVAFKTKTEFAYPPSYFLTHRETLDGLGMSIRILQNTNMNRHILMYYQNESREFEHEDELQKVKHLLSALQRQVQLLENRPDPVTHLASGEAQDWVRKINEFLELNQKSFTRWFSSSWRSLRKELEAYCKKQGILFDGVSVRQHLEQIETFLKYESMRAEAKSHHLFSDAPLLNEHQEWEKWIGLKKRAIEFLSLYVQAQVIYPKWLPNLNSPKDLEQLAATSFSDSVLRTIELTEITKQLRSIVDRLHPYFEQDQLVELRKDVDNGIYDHDTYLRLLGSLDDFESIVQLDQRKTALNQLQTRLIELCLEKAPLDSRSDIVEHWQRLIENSYYNQWILQIESEEPHVKEVSTELYISHVARYRDLLKEKRIKLPRLIDHRLFQRSLDVTNPNRRTLQHEAKKKRSQPALRKMMSSFAEDLLRLVPCWLCTPEAVSAIFPHQQGLFDLVIFDEASQLPVENAVPSILRAQKIVVAGDEKQLPPSNFFQRTADDEELEDEEKSAEYKNDSDKTAQSLLEWGKSKFTDQWLAWHYRSKHQALINFSNYAFYGRRMQIAPNSTFGTEKPLEFIQVNGTWIGQQNLVEAERTVDIVIDLLRNRPEKTLGIITFNAKQTELINDIFDRRSAESPEVQLLLEEAKQRKNGEEDVGLFVKNIENVQGDERDIIVFSVAYAKNEEGKMPSSFGPLQREAGPNRLNVAITRAKEKAYLVCSFDPAEWHRAETYKSGVRLLKRYLEYGKAISEGNDQLVETILKGILDTHTVQAEDDQGVYESIFEEEVGEALKRRGYEIKKQVGFSGYRIDLAVLHPSNPDIYLLGIECDGATYHSSKVARERDLYRQRFLESQGWTIHRIWSRNWWASPEKELDRLVQKIEQMVETSHHQHV